MSASLRCARQHPSYGDCLEVKREYYQNCSVLGCVTRFHSQQHTHMSSSYRSSRLGLSHWDPYAVRRGICLELYYCNMVEMVLVGFKPYLKDQCFDTVGLVIWPVKIVPEMTYNVFVGTLNVAQSVYRPSHYDLTWALTIDILASASMVTPDSTEYTYRTTA